MSADIVLALDSSAAVVAHWFQIQAFAREFVDRIVLAGHTRLAVIQFDSIAKVVIPFGLYNDGPAMKQHINKLVADPYGRRRTDAALEMARERLFAVARPGVPRILIVLEHGKIVGGDPSVNWNQLLAEPAERLHASGIITFAVGITPVATEEELHLIGGDPSHVVRVGGYPHLLEAVPKLIKHICALPGIRRKGGCVCKAH